MLKCTRPGHIPHSKPTNHTRPGSGGHDVTTTTTITIKMMRTNVATALLCALALALAALQTAHGGADAANIVTIHGLLGFGPKELLGVGYWGFWNIPLTVRPNYLTYLEDWRWGWSCGCIGSVCTVYCKKPVNTVAYASVGPISSNWDRACELYAQIKGTRTDYGAAHAAKFGHSRWGPDYTGKGFFPSWSASNPVSLVGHSMGGQTARMLEYLLQNGDADERAFNYAGQAAISPLFSGSGRAWIKSMHTVATPHNGSPLYTALGVNIVDKLRDILGNIGSLLTFLPVLGSATWGYQFDLEQWGSSQTGYSGSDGGFKNYLNAVLNPNNPLWNTNDLAHYEMGPQAAYNFNRRPGARLAYPGTYYFAHTTSRTTRCSADSRLQCPRGDMELLMAPTGLIIGSISISPNACKTYIQCTNADAWCQRGAPSTPVNFCYDSAWQENDGLVPFRSSWTPMLGVSNYVPPKYRDDFTRSWAAATWYYRNHTTVGNGKPRDHIQIIGLDSQALWAEDGSDNTYNLIAEEVAYAWSR